NRHDPITQIEIDTDTEFYKLVDLVYENGIAFDGWTRLVCDTIVEEKNLEPHDSFDVWGRAVRFLTDRLTEFEHTQKKDNEIKVNKEMMDFVKSTLREFSKMIKWVNRLKNAVDVGAIASDYEHKFWDLIGLGNNRRDNFKNIFKPKEGTKNLKIFNKS